MMKYLLNRKNALKNKKGFTLIEIIVVLVILAILAAATIPTMLGFVEDAKGKTLIAEARSCYLAGQTIATEEAVGKSNTDGKIRNGLNAASAATPTDEIAKRLQAMLAPDITLGAAATDIVATAVYTVSGGEITKVVYTKKIDSKTFEISLEQGKAATVTKVTTTP